MKINDSHCHYGNECLLGTIGRMRLVSNNTYEKVKRDLDAYNVENQVLFAQPEPSSTRGYLEGTLLFLPKLAHYYAKDTGKIFSELVSKLRGKDYEDWDPNQLFSEIFFGKVDYSEANKELNTLEDKRIKFIPFVNSKFKPSDIEGFGKIRGIKYYEPNGAIPDTLLEYLNDNHLNLLPHLTLKTQSDPEKFLSTVERNDGMKFQVPHWAAGYEGIINALEEYDNLFIDTAASTFFFYKKFRKVPFGEIAREHPDKILFGSDEPWTNLGKEIEAITNLGLGKETEEKILYKNYYRLWK